MPLHTGLLLVLAAGATMIMAAGADERGNAFHIRGVPAGWSPLSNALTQQRLEHEPKHALPMNEIIAKVAAAGLGRVCHRPFTQRCIIELLMAERYLLHPSTLRLRAPVDTGRVQAVVRSGRIYEQLDVLRELIEGGSNVDAQPDLFQGASAVMMAAAMGDTASLQILLSGGASPETKKASGLAAQASALMLAAGQGHDDAVRLLLEHGADVHRTVAQQSTTALRRFGTTVANASPVMWAAQGAKARTLRLLTAAGADIDRRFASGATLLLWFVKQGAIASVQALIQAGANVDIPDERGYSPLMHAALRDDEEGLAIARLLLNAGADPSARALDGKSAQSFAKQLPTTAASHHRDPLTAKDLLALGLLAMTCAISKSRGAASGKPKRLLSPTAAQARKMAANSPWRAPSPPAGQRDAPRSATRRARSTATAAAAAAVAVAPAPAATPGPPATARQQGGQQWRPVVPSLDLTECALSSPGWSSESSSRSSTDFQRWCHEQVAMWAAGAVPTAYASYVVRLIEHAKIDGAAMCALDRSRLTSLLKRGTATLRCPMDARAASEVASCLLARRDVLLEAGAAKAAVQPAPDHFFCSLTLEVMADPVRVCTGQVYEREEITRWLRGNIAPRCPNTNVVLRTKALTEDAELKAEIREWRAASAAGAGAAGP